MSDVVAIRKAWNKLMDFTDDLHDLNCGTCDDAVQKFLEVLYSDE